MRRRSRLSEVEQRNLMTMKANLAALSKHPSWPELEEVVRIHIGQIEKQVLRETLYARTVDPENIHFLRGVIEGLKYLADIPSKAERSLESMLREQGIAMRNEEVA